VLASPQPFPRSPAESWSSAAASAVREVEDDWALFFHSERSEEAYYFQGVGPSTSLPFKCSQPAIDASAAVFVQYLIPQQLENFLEVTPAQWQIIFRR